MNNHEGPTPTETLLGGADVNVTHLDGSKETVRIRQVPLGEFPALLAAQDDECAAACLYTKKPREWFDGLAVESQEALIVEGERVNADFFGRWCQRRIARQERLMPGVTEKVLRTFIPAEPESPPSQSRNSAPPLVRGQG